MASIKSQRAVTKAFPRTAVESALRDAVTRLGEMSAGMRQPWEPEFDSLALVKVVLVVEKVLPGVKIAPEKVVRRGGYRNIEEAVQDITDRVERQTDRQ